MYLEPVTKQTFNEYYKHKKNDFVYAERRNAFFDKLALSKSNFKQCHIYKNNNKIGYICYWDLGDFIFIEHFAIYEHLRCKGNGTEFFKWFINNQSKPVIFEVDSPTDQTSRRRIKFYNNLGFVLNDFLYVQPSYHIFGKQVPMSIMSKDKKLSKTQYDKYVKQIYEQVYNKKYKK